MKLSKYAIAILSVITLTTGCTLLNFQSSNISKNQNIKVALSDEPTSLDPRKVRSLNSINIIRQLFEGLMNLDKDGNPIFGIAEKVDVSSDNKTYTFTLRNASWSNGQQVVAQDFEYAVKYQLNKENGCPNSYQLFVIKNAKNAYEGTSSIDDVQITAKDDKTLVVSLENPTPYFLKLVATHPFFPVSKAFAEKYGANWIENGNNICVSNGFLTLDNWLTKSELILKKNATYWNAQATKLSAVEYPIIDDFTAVNMFENHELDWAGSPCAIIPTDMIQNLKEKNALSFSPAAGTQFVRVNTENAALNNSKMRKALAYAIDSKSIVDHIMQADQVVATGFVPPCLGLKTQSFYTSCDKIEALRLFNEALSDLNIAKEALPKITLSFVANDRLQKIAQVIQQNFKDAFGIDIDIQACESKMFYQKVFSKDYQLALGSWFADFIDPISFLSIFQYKENGTNNTQWSNPEYTRLLESSSFEVNSNARMAILNDAQKILMDEMPILPIFYFSMSYLKNAHLQNAFISPLGYIDIQNAFISE